jgi:hypothetical protein
MSGVRGTRQGDTVYGDDGRVVFAPRRPKPTPPVFKQQEEQKV